MTDLYFSTVYRYAPNDQAGELVHVDWQKKQVLQKVFVGPKTLVIDDPNPRGNTRGGRGVAVMGERVVVSSYCELQVYDRNLKHLFNVTHPLMSGLHEVHQVNERDLWITSTTLDAGLLINIENGEVSRQYWPREMTPLVERWKLTPFEVDKQVDNRVRYLSETTIKDKSHLHFNALATWHGEEYGLINRFGAVVNLNRQEVIFEDPSLFGAHNLVILDDGTMFINDTRNQGVCLYNMQGERIKRINLLPFHKAGRAVQRYHRTEKLRGMLEKYHVIKRSTAMPFFVRGMDLVDDLLYVGMAPASVLCIDWQKDKLMDVYNYTQDARMAVHGLKIVP